MRLEAIIDATEARDVRRRIARLLATEPNLATAEALRDALNAAEAGAGDFIGERIPALPSPALPIRPPGLRLPSGDSDDDRRRDGRFPFPEFRSTPELTPTARR